VVIKYDLEAGFLNHFKAISKLNWQARVPHNCTVFNNTSDEKYVDFY
jgi:hypothetical protein